MPRAGAAYTGLKQKPMQHTEARIQPVTAEQLQRLDELMLVLATGFIDLPIERIDGAIDDGLQRVVRTLAVDRCAISRVRPDTGDIRFTYAWPANDYPGPPTRVPSEHWPWAVAAARRGRIIAFSRLDELPPEAAVDRAAWQAMGTRSHISVPLLVGGELAAMLHLGSFRSERQWDDGLLQRLRRVAEIFAIALTRKQAQEALDRATGFERVARTTLSALLGANPGAEAAAIEGGLRELGLLLGVDWVALWERDAGAAEGRVNKQWRADSAPAGGMRLAASRVPWLDASIAAGRSVRFGRDAELPDGGQADRATFDELGLRALLAVPVPCPSGGCGMLSCATLQRPRAWPEGDVRGVTLLAEVFASLHARRLAEKREQAAVMDAAQWRERLAHLVRVHTVGEMSAALAHEINQPLMAIANYALAARRRSTALPQADKVVELLDKVIAQTTRAGDVVGRLRSMVKRNEIQAAPVHLERLVDDCIDMVRMECELRDIRLERKVDGPLPTLVADGIQLQQVVLNLLRNAIEAMEEAAPDAPRQISIEVGRAGERELRVQVADHGLGIAEEDLERIFDAFYSTKVTGLGIGLSLCRKLIEAHGGRLVARDRAEGGAVFEFTLPLADAGGPDGA